jgi:hypothetical protein
MIDKSMIVTTMSALALSATAFAQGTADEAKAMLMKAVAAVKADKANALSIYFADATLASAFVARWCVTAKVGRTRQNA